MNPSWVLLIGAIVVSMAGQTLLKSGSRADTLMGQMLHLHTIVGLGLYGAAAMLYIVALRRIPLSVALPATAISYIAAAFVGHYTFGEPIGPVQITAITLIGAGVILLAFA